MIRKSFNSISKLCIVIAFVLSMAPSMASQEKMMKLPEGFNTEPGGDPNQTDFIKIRGPKGCTAYVDKSGKIVIPPTEDEIKYVGEHRFLRTHWDEAHENIDLIGVGGKHIAFLPANIRVRGEKFSDGLLQVMTDSQVYGFINIDGKFQIKPDRIVECSDFKEGFAKVWLAERGGQQSAALIDRNGQVLFGPIELGSVENFNNGLAYVELNTGAGMIDRDGNYVLPAQYEHINPSEKFIAALRKGHWSVFSLDGKLIKKFPASVTWLDCQGDLWTFGEGKSAAAPSEAGKYGLVDVTGKVVTPAKYDYLCKYPSGQSVVGNKQNGKMIFGVLDKHGILVQPIEFERVSVGDDGVPICHKKIEYKFDSAQWLRSPSARTNEWKQFLKEYDLIGMDEEILYELLGRALPESNPTAPKSTPKRVQYSLVSGFCGNAYQGVEIEIDENKKVSGWRSVDGWEGEHSWNRDNVVYVEPKNSIMQSARLVPKNVAKEYEQN